MGCAGCELFPQPSLILKKVDEAITAQTPDWPEHGAKTEFTSLINEAYTSLAAPSEQHINDVTTTNIYHFRDKFTEVVSQSKGKDAAAAARKVIEEMITCYAAKLHLNKGFSILNPERKPNKGYAPTFEKLTRYAGRMEESAALPDLLGRASPTEPWKADLPRMIFVSDMGDAFSSSNDFDFLEKDVMPHITSKQGKKHLWLWLTKRPHLMADFAERIGGFPENVCAMTTMTSGDDKNQKRLTNLKKVKASIKSLSIEPLWEDIKEEEFDLTGIDWVIVGGESGSGKYTREFKLEWAENLRKLCEKQGVAFFLKQMGGKPIYQDKPLKLKNAHGGDWDEWPDGFKHREFPQAFHDYRADKKVVLPIPRPSPSKNELSDTLSDDEKVELEALETKIKEGMSTFMAVGDAILEIREKKLYREKYDRFEDYCEKELGMSRQHANRQAKAAKVKKLLDPYLEKYNLADVTTERQLREFGRLSHDQMCEVIEVIAEEVQPDASGKKTIPYKAIKDEIDKCKNKPAEQSKPTKDEGSSNDSANQSTGTSPTPTTKHPLEERLEEALNLVKDGKVDAAITLIHQIIEEDEAA